MTASAGVIDFTNVKEGGNFNPKRRPEGDYKAKITKVEDAESKKDGKAQWLFTIQVGSGTYPYYCKHEENQYWKIRNLLVAAGMTVPKKKVKVDPNKLVGKFIGVTLEDDEYEGKKKSVVAATFPVSELEDEDVEDEADDADDEDEDDEPTPPKKAKKPPVEDDDDEDEDDEPAPPKKKAKPAPVEDDDDEDEDEDDTPPPPKKKKPAPVEDDDDDLEEIDIDDT